MAIIGTCYKEIERNREGICLVVTAVAMSNFGHIRRATMANLGKIKMLIKLENYNMYLAVYKHLLGPFHCTTSRHIFFNHL